MNDLLLDSFIASLQKVASEIHILENEAAYALYKNKDRDEYREKQTVKTKLLCQLPTVLSEFKGKLSESLNAYAKDRLGGISFSAEKALVLDSIFYMSSILYPEDYQEGDKNDLDIFIEQLVLARGIKYSLAENSKDFQTTKNEINL